MGKYILGAILIVLTAVGIFFTTRTNNQDSNSNQAEQLLADQFELSNSEFETDAQFEDETEEPQQADEAKPYPTALILTLRDGSQVSLADFQNKKAVVLDFWASWCHNCQRNMPNLSSFYEKYRDDVEIIAVNMDESLSKIDSFYENYSIAFPTAVDPSAKEAIEEFGIRYTNTHVLITKDGTMLDPVLGDLSEEKLQQLIEA